MSSHLSTLKRDVALIAVAALGSITVGVAAHASSDDPGGDVAVVNTETVQVKQSADGDIDSKRVYEQLSMTGKGTVRLDNPVSTAGLRNLDGFGDIETKGGDQVVDATVDGRKKTRSVSDYTKALPLKVETTYTLDGKAVEPGDVVGGSGKLAVFFKVTNVTGTKQAVSYADGTGRTVTREVTVPIPIVGSLDTTTPSSFTNVRSNAANLAGDGKGGMKLSFTMTLFPPIGEPTSTFGYTADIDHGVVPEVDVTALPVDPLQSPTFKRAAGAYQEGADTGAQLVDGATQIDSNLLKLRDGSADLLAGLVKLRSGANQLDTGLSGQAEPGAQALSAGAADLHKGLGDLHDGTGRLAGGSTRLAGGTGTALAGSKQLTGGLKQINGGLGQLSGQLPSATDGITRLQGGIEQLLAGMGNAQDPETLIGGLAALHTGLTTLQGGTQQVRGGLEQLTSPTTGLPAAKGGVDQIASQLQAGADSINPGDADSLAGAIGSLKGYCAQIADPVQKACSGTVDAIAAKVNGPGPDSSKSKLTALKNGLNQAVAGLGQVSGGIGSAVSALNTQLIPGVGQISDGLSTQALPGVEKLQGGAAQVKGGLTDVSGGLDQLADGVGAAVDGVLQLQDGSSTAYAGSSDLTTGLGKLDDGAGDLADGAQQLDAGAGTADAGSGRLADGAKTLSDGISDAANGSGRIADGLGTATDGAAQLPKGATALSDQGTKQLIAKGKDTTAEYGEKVAVVDTGSKLATTRAMAYGAPKGATGLTAYSYEISGLDGEGGKNLARGLGGLALLGAGACALGLRRRFV